MRIHAAYAHNDKLMRFQFFIKRKQTHTERRVEWTIMQKYATKEKKNSDAFTPSHHIFVYSYRQTLYIALRTKESAIDVT